MTPLRAITAVLGLSASLGAATGCASVETGDDRVNPAMPLWFHRPSGAMQVLYTRPLTIDSRASGEPVERGRAEIDAAHGRVFVGTSDHGLYALRAGGGSSIWRFETLGSVQCEPLYDAELDVVYFGSNDGSLYAVNASDGRLVWRYDSGAEVSRRPVLRGETLYFANGADNLFAIQRRTGATLWRIHRTPALGMEISGYAGPAVDGRSVFIAFSDGHVGAYDMADGSERWPPLDLAAEAEQSVGPDALKYLDADTTPVPADLGAAGRVVFVASYTGGVVAIDQERGVPVWRDETVTGVTDLMLWREPAHAPRPGTPEYVPGGPPVPLRELLLASSGSSGLWALEPATGKTVWRDPVPEGGVTAPAALSGALLVGTTRYGAFLLSPLDGRPIDGIDLGSGFSETPATIGNRGFLLTNGGTLVAIQVTGPR
ncbi:MAG TPA: PQQ-binding-like beta-propeller repeat protein [Polyangiaceae bacterium]|jgi:outer membrane protein assembly factor BamB|nr:PQQ-binding-like beta-propeller repeat protein [Polyangiaceae bacterium]